ncbi:zinc finger protein 513-like [Portunus trituberculatus]|uniref:zinc finger protein 513-like n=1 Tax=Portunus trituberculatus TaxID=210409 RepID=UPI001E1D04B9|nr:zinc finger protein 513-like [Portunus trituberculatus]
MFVLTLGRSPLPVIIVPTPSLRRATSRIICEVTIVKVRVEGQRLRTHRSGQSGGQRSHGASMKVHQCDHCPYSTVVKSNLIRHVRSHTGEKPFSCPQCVYTTTIKDNLKRHVLTHTGEKPFACPLCSYRSIQKIHLTSHLRTHCNSAGDAFFNNAQ